MMSSAIATDPAAVSGWLSSKVMRYGEIIERTVRAAKEPGWSPDTGWQELESLVALDTFRRVGNDKAAMGWEVYKALLSGWATTTDFWSEFRRISEVGNLVFLELTEHNTPRGGAESVVNSLSLYEFDDDGRLCHLDIYLQHD